jgi:hypothetical protein
MCAAVPLAVLATAAPADPASSPWIGNVVTPVIILGLIIGRVLVTGRELRRAEEQLEASTAALARKDEQIAALQAGLIDRAIPALTRATDIIAAVSPLLVTETSVRRPTEGSS